MSSHSNSSVCTKCPPFLSSFPCPSTLLPPSFLSLPLSVFNLLLPLSPSPFCFSNSFSLPSSLYSSLYLSSFLPLSLSFFLYASLFHFPSLSPLLCFILLLITICFLFSFITFFSLCVCLSLSPLLLPCPFCLSGEHFPHL